MKESMKWNKIVIISILSFLNIIFCSLPALAIPYTSSQYYCLMDSDTGQVIFSKNLDEMRHMASTTKMMTAILASEYAGLEEIAVVSAHADRTPEFTIGLREGQEISIAELLKVALIRSSNDAAVVLAEHVAGDEQLFAHLMSKKAFLLGAINTHFANASGLPADNHYSTAYDLAQMGRYLLSTSYISDLVATRTTSFQHPGYREPLTINNTNGLLSGYSGANGIKTGTTNAAGKCLVASAIRSNRQLIAVVLKSGDRNGDCARLLNYGFNKTEPIQVIDKQIPFKTLQLLKAEKLTIDVYPSEDVYLWEGEAKTNIEKKVRLNYLAEAPIAKGQVLGTLGIYSDGKLVKNVGLTCQEEVNKETGFIPKLINYYLYLKNTLLLSYSV